ncbi:Glucan 1,3-beta-glucosidase [Grifola frondosa]|uniref:Glucan 1,3-beta-glucosidase n=1 Tax=Grifola frondosa TaxID=5627 RepID=A0A1C7M2Y6_GRIFR|nr:Glucan 1,3-beta-glucosidase [Grifola frondosa]
MEQIAHQGTSPFNSNPSGYQVFRNVKDFGAKGDGVTDDTAAINAAISSGNRCGEGCGQSSTSPAVVFFPQGTYLVSSPIIAYYYTQIIGDAKIPPTLLASANFVGIAVIDADPYLDGGAQWYINQNNFYRSVRNFVIDTTRMPASTSGTGIHWQVSQATSLMNIVFQLSTASGNAHQGVWMENGSGGFMGDLVLMAASLACGLAISNSLKTSSRISFSCIAVFGVWNWGWTFQGVTINNCQVGFDLTTGSTTKDNQGIGAEAIIDAVVTNTPIFVRSSQPSNGILDGSIILNHIQLNNVPTAVGVVGGAVVLNGGTTTIDSWAQGDVYTGTNPTTKIFGKTHPQYAAYAVDQFISVKSQGAKGDGQTDDTAAIQAVFAEYAGCKIIFFDAGTYLVSSTITIPAGTQVVGEAWSTIMATGNAFTDYNNPRVVVQVGAAGSQGVVEITDMIFTARGPAAGAIIVEWNVHDPAGQQGAAGTWDTHIILGGKTGSNLQASNCPTSGAGGNNCFAAFMALHLTPSSSAYLEGLWVWLADHDMDSGGTQISLYSGRGIMSESQGPVWLIGTASEHSIMYQYSLVNAQNHYLGMIQTETPYFQPNPVPPAPFIPNSNFKDPTLGPGAAWALSVSNSQNILVFGAGLYSFFQDYQQACLDTFSCQSQIVNIDSASTIGIYSLSTVATTSQLSVNAQGIINNADNRNGFAQTVTAWTRT